MVVPVKFEANVFVGCTAGVDWFVPNTEVPDEFGNELPNGPIDGVFCTPPVNIKGCDVFEVPNTFRGCDTVEGLNVNVEFGVVEATVVAVGCFIVKLNMMDNFYSSFIPEYLKIEYVEMCVVHRRS
jgi:hypothetical protein